jgi:hypothetical protein
MMLALLAGIGTFIGINALLGALHGVASGASQFMNMLLRFSVFALPIRMVGWFAATWAGWSAFDAMGGF